MIHHSNSLTLVTAYAYEHIFVYTVVHTFLHTPFHFENPAQKKKNENFNPQLDQSTDVRSSITRDILHFNEKIFPKYATLKKMKLQKAPHRAPRWPGSTKKAPTRTVHQTNTKRRSTRFHFLEFRRTRVPTWFAPDGIKCRDGCSEGSGRSWPML